MNMADRLDIPTVHDPTVAVGQAGVPTQAPLIPRASIARTPVVDHQSVIGNRNSPEMFCAGNIHMVDTIDQVRGDATHGAFDELQGFADCFERFGGKARNRRAPLAFES